MIKSAIRYSAPWVGVMTAVCILMIGVISVAIISQVQATDGSVPTRGSGDRLVTIHDRNQEKVILTKAGSVQQALEEAGVVLDKKDAVEPALNEELIDTSYHVNIYRARPVIVSDGVVREKIMTPYQSADKIVQDAGLELHDADKTTVEPIEDIIAEGAGLELTIDRATPFTLILYGKKTDAYTQATTVNDMLKEKNITLGSNDELSLAGSTSISAGMTVELWRNGKQTVTEEQEIPFSTEKIQDAAREVGYKEVRTPGAAGKKSVTYEILIQNGRELSRTEIQSVITVEPKKQVEVVGTKMSNTFSGDFAGALARLRSCEAGGNYANKKNPKYRGAYQYDYATWANYQGFYDPADAPPAVQDERAWQTYQKRGWQPWPSCSKTQGLQDIYR